MKTVIGILLVILSVFLGLYVGVYFMFIGGIEQFVHSIISSPISVSGIAWGLLRVVCSGIVGWISFFVCLISGLNLIFK